MRRQIQPGRGVNRAYRTRWLHAATCWRYQTSAYQENDAGQKLLRAGKERTGMRETLRGQAAQCNGEQVGRGNYGNQRAGDFTTGIIGVR